ncbi:MAG: valine--tRNA ligase [Mycoplasmatales bacterium]
MKELNEKYQHQTVENGKYEKWLAEKAFFVDEKTATKPYSIILPPPNVTGKLHLGHSWDVTLQDIIIRYKRMNGFDAVWLPGMDHAGIATQAKVAERLKEEGIQLKDLTREEFLKYAWNWKEEYAQHIRSAWAAMGLALDYDKEVFTLDSNVSEAVKKVFVELYKQGKIYQGTRIINWDPAAQTALSNIEVIHKEVNGNEHYFKYVSVEDENVYLEVMTTRPETMFGDGALAVHPDDERYSKYVGKLFYVPNTKTAIPVIVDDYVSIDKGSGVVKITMAHDPNDYHVGIRHNLEPRIIMNLDGTMATSEYVPEAFQGLDRFEARKLQVSTAEQNGLLLKVEPLVHSVGHSERSGAIVEPLLSKQWFVKMDGFAKNSLEYQKTAEKIEFHPNRFEATFLRWMEEVEDWCISRQLWWGHQIPAWTHKETGELYVEETAPADLENWIQDEDVLDTWFSSALWPFVLTEWKNEDMKKFYPTNALVTGYDIIFFWVSRMIFQGLEFTDQKPFENVLIHGLIRAEDGRKMSKSLGNGILPEEVIEKYGADSLRFFLASASAPGQDLRYSNEKMESTWNFINKIWNISRYVLQNTQDVDYVEEYLLFDGLLETDKWILSKLNDAIKTANEMMEKFEFGIAASAIYDFAWNDFAAWYLETTKISLNNEQISDTEKQQVKVILKHVLGQIIKMLHPFMPFVTTEIFEQLSETGLLNSSWPAVIDAKCAQDFENVQEIVTSVRNFKAENDLKPSQEVELILQTSCKFANNELAIIERLCRASKLEIVADFEPTNHVSKVLTNVTVHINEEGLFDLDAKIADLKKQLEQIVKEITRSYSMLTNANFLAKANAEKIDSEKVKAQQYLNRHNETVDLLNTLGVEAVINEKCEELVKLL